MKSLLRKIVSYIVLLFRWYSGSLVVRNIFDYNNVIKSRSDIILNGILPVSGRHYGYTPSLRYSLRKYSNSKGGLYCVVEHGAFFKNFSPELEDYQSKYPVVLVNSEERVDVLKKHMDRCIIPIGPDIYYCNEIFNDYIMKLIKMSLGRTLLVFPAHSTSDTAIQVDRDRFIRYVEKIKKEHNYDTVLVCLYHFDIERGEDYYYLNKGWRVVSAGLPYNYDFKNILKTIILLSDYVINQEFSTNVGWSIFLGKPVTIYTQDQFKVISNDGKEIERNQSYGSVYDDDLNTILKDYNEEITKRQYDYFAYHYGFDKIRTPDEIRLILKFSKEAYRKRLNKKKMLKLSSKRRYKDIKDIIMRGF